MRHLWLTMSHNLVYVVFLLQCLGIIEYELLSFTWKSPPRSNSKCKRERLDLKPNDRSMSEGGNTNIYPS